MLKIKTFKLEEDTLINDFLDKYPRANGGTVFLSEGKIAIPYEDGEKEPKEVIIIRKKTEINALNENKSLLTVSVSVDEAQLKDIQSKIEKVKESITIIGGSKEAYEKNKDFEVEKTTLEHFENDIQSSIKRNLSEIERLNINIAVHEEQLANLIA